MKYSIDQYKQKAKDLFGQLTATSGDQSYSIFSSTNYWQVGNVVDSLFDYMQMAVNDPDPNFNMTPAQAQACTAAIYQHYQDLTATSNGCWYDDFGWWGIASAKAYDITYSTVFGSLASSFQQVAVQCWNVMNAGKNNGRNFGAPMVWNTCDQKTFATVAPKYAGGVWQYDIFACPVPVDCSFTTYGATPINVDCNGVAQNVATLGPYQLSVVNGLYLVLATRLAVAGAISPNFAKSVYAFTDNWCNTDTGVDTSLLNRYGTTSLGLIRERVSKYANGTDVNYYDAANAWCGDQGLFAGGMLDYYTAFKNPDAMILALKIFSGVRAQMQQMPTTDNAMKIIAPFVPYDYPQVPFSNDPNDYESGLGVFMRYLYYGYTHNVNIKNMANAPDYRLALSNAADAAYADIIPPSNVNIFTAFNRLASLMIGIIQNIAPDGDLVGAEGSVSSEEAV